MEAFWLARKKSRMAETQESAQIYTRPLSSPKGAWGLGTRLVNACAYSTLQIASAHDRPIRFETDSVHARSLSVFVPDRILHA